jgi:large conductance mechanosensitive channel
MWKEFKAFLTTSNALALAVGVIIGAATGKVVSAVVDDLLMPIIGLGMPNGDWRDAQFVLATQTDAAGKVSVNAIKYGHLIGTLLDFVIIAAVVFAITKALLKPAPKDETQTCPFCKETLPIDATKCRACTSTLTGAAAS